MGKSNAQSRLLVLVLLPETGVCAHGIGEERVMVRQVDHLVGLVGGGKGGALLLAMVLVIAATQLDPLGQLLDAAGESSWWV